MSVALGSLRQRDMVGKWFGFEWREVLEEAIDLFERGDFDEATKAFEACRTTDESDPRLAFYLGKCYAILAAIALDDRDFAIAAANAENAIAVNPEFPDIHVLAAKSYLGLDRNVLARHHLNKAMLLKPGYSEAKQLLAGLEAAPSPLSA